MIVASIMIALMVNGLMINPGYNWLLNKVILNRKPFNCVLCVSFWLGCLVAVQGLISGNYLLALTPLISSFLATAISRWFESLPVRIN